MRADFLTKERGVSDISDAAELWAEILRLRAQVRQLSNQDGHRNAEPSALGGFGTDAQEPSSARSPHEQIAPLSAETVTDRVTAYLSNGGLFNPELANHEAVRDLLIAARDKIAELEQQASLHNDQCAQFEARIKELERENAVQKLQLDAYQIRFNNITEAWRSGGNDQILDAVRKHITAKDCEIADKIVMGEFLSNRAAAEPRGRQAGEWIVAPGDPTHVFVPGLVKPINCYSKTRAAQIVAAMNGAAGEPKAAQPVAWRRSLDPQYDYSDRYRYRDDTGIGAPDEWEPLYLHPYQATAETRESQLHAALFAIANCDPSPTDLKNWSEWVLQLARDNLNSANTKPAETKRIGRCGNCAKCGEPLPHTDAACPNGCSVNTGEGHQ